MRYIRRRVEELVHAVPTVRLHDLTAAGFRFLLDDITVVTEQRAGFDELDGFIEAISCGFDDADVVGVFGGGVADVVGFV